MIEFTRNLKELNQKHSILEDSIADKLNAEFPDLEYSYSAGEGNLASSADIFPEDARIIALLPLNSHTAVRQSITETYSSIQGMPGSKTVIDLDIFSPHSEIIGETGTEGISDHFLYGVSPAKIIYSSPDDPLLNIIGAGTYTPRASEIYADQRWNNFIDWATDQSDGPVIILGPPLDKYQDLAALAKADHVLIIADQLESQSQEKLSELLTRISRNFTGKPSFRLVWTEEETPVPEEEKEPEEQKPSDAEPDDKEAVPEESDLPEEDSEITPAKEEELPELEESEMDNAELPPLETVIQEKTEKTSAVSEGEKSQKESGIDEDEEEIFLPKELLFLDDDEKSQSEKTGDEATLDKEMDSYLDIDNLPGLTDMEKIRQRDSEDKASSEEEEIEKTVLPERAEEEDATVTEPVIEEISVQEETEVEEQVLPEPEVEETVEIEQAEPAAVEDTAETAQDAQEESQAIEEEVTGELEELQEEEALQQEEIPVDESEISVEETEKPEVKEPAKDEEEVDPDALYTDLEPEDEVEAEPVAAGKSSESAGETDLESLENIKSFQDTLNAPPPDEMEIALDTDPLGDSPIETEAAQEPEDIEETIEAESPIEEELTSEEIDVEEELSQEEPSAEEEIADLESIEEEAEEKQEAVEELDEEGLETLDEEHLEDLPEEEAAEIPLEEQPEEETVAVDEEAEAPAVEEEEIAVEEAAATETVDEESTDEVVGLDDSDIEELDEEMAEEPVAEDSETATEGAAETTEEAVELEEVPAEDETEAAAAEEAPAVEESIEESEDTADEEIDELLSGAADLEEVGADIALDDLDGLDLEDQAAAVTVKKPKKRSKAKSLIAFAAIVVLTAGMFFLWQQGTVSSLVRRLPGLSGLQNLIPGLDRKDEEQLALEEKARADSIQQALEQQALLDAMPKYDKLAYSIQIGSYRYLTQAIAAQNILRGKGLPNVYITPLSLDSLGDWNRLYMGMFESAEKADTALFGLGKTLQKSAADFKIIGSAVRRHTPLVLKISEAASADSLEFFKQRLEENNVPTYMVKLQTDSTHAPVFRLYVGAFESEHQAVLMRTKIFNLGVNAKIIEREGTASDKKG